MSVLETESGMVFFRSDNWIGTLNEIIRARNVSERDRRLKTEYGDVVCGWSRESREEDVVIRT